ncbi:Uncharacterised protein [Scardovia inopinata]|uniref:Uncharacterized protein n=1 Tax=Scardovia inopinata F0304 TaxID=641146 RepID=W1MXI3_SCAIO|nr:hypothetical protein [Scardovia inopinata]EQW16340.1 hypothetical protein HMPREF9020_01517 [Scardovia inopinata F0304]SUV50813.1 Uncharacterised protein [Scardovia inopinata]
MTNKVTSYHQARQIVEQVNGGIPTAEEGHEDAEYYHVPMDSDFVMLDDCDWYVNKKTGKAERFYSSPVMPDVLGNRR